MGFLRQYSICRASRLLFPALALFSGMLSTSYAQVKITLTVSAAASLKDALAETEAVYERGHANIKFSNNFGSSGTLAAQIDQGAPVDVFISAAAKPMDDLAVKRADRYRHAPQSVEEHTCAHCAAGLETSRFSGTHGQINPVIALGDPASVPAGQYGKQTLLSLHLWDQLNAKLVLGKDVRQVLTYVETGNADAGLVYATDAMSFGQGSSVADCSRIDARPDRLSRAAVVKGEPQRRGLAQVIDYLASPAAQAIFVKHMDLQ
jgi:molybdate transport system substrate-binding protein